MLVLAHKVFLRNDSHVLDRWNLNSMADPYYLFFLTTFPMENVDFFIVNHHEMSWATRSQISLAPIFRIISVNLDSLPKLRWTFIIKGKILRLLILADILSNIFFIETVLMVIIFIFLVIIVFIKEIKLSVVWSSRVRSLIYSTSRKSSWNDKHAWCSIFILGLLSVIWLNSS